MQGSGEVATFPQGTDSARRPGRLCDCMQLLRSTSAGQVVHDTSKGSRPLLAHLDGTRMLLEAAGYPEHVCLAGLFHSIYGTNRFTYQTVLADNAGRKRVSNVAGPQAERLAFLFCNVKRPRTLDNAAGARAAEGQKRDEQIRAFTLTAREHGEAFAVTEQELDDLLAIEVANCLEQDLRVRFTSRRSQHSFTVLKPHPFFVGAARDLLSQYCKLPCVQSHHCCSSRKRRAEEIEMLYPVADRWAVQLRHAGAQLLCSLHLTISHNTALIATRSIPWPYYLATNPLDSFPNYLGPPAMQHLA
jgi:hypothetical protein